MLKDSYKYAESDRDARMLREQQVEAKRTIEAMEAALAKDGEVLLNAEEMAQLRQMIEQLRSVAEGEDARAIEKKIETVNRESEFYAARRMDQSVQQALSGKNVEEINP